MPHLVNLVCDRISFKFNLSDMRWNMLERRLASTLLVGYICFTLLLLDPLMSECLIYQLKPGTTMVGFDVHVHGSAVVNWIHRLVNLTATSLPQFVLAVKIFLMGIVFSRISTERSPSMLCQTVLQSVFYLIAMLQVLIKLPLVS